MKKILNLLLLIIVFSASSCNDWLDVNTDPNNPSDVPAELILPVAQTSIAGSVGGDFAIVGGLWSQHWTQSNVSSQYKTLDSYNLSPTDYNTSWTEMYSGGLNDLEVIKQKASASGNWNLYLIATCVQTYGFQILADFFEKVPYSQALQGLKFPSPKFDDGKEVYKGLIASLDAALAKDFAASTNKKVTTDLILGGDVTEWKKFANTLKLKIYLRQIESSEAATAKAEITKILNNGIGFLSNAAITSFIDEPDRSNPLYENNIRQLNTPGNLRCSNTLKTYLESKGDADRLNAYYEKGSTGAIVGLEQGNYEANTSVTPGPSVSLAKISATTPFYFFSADESAFLVAEAKLRVSAPVGEVKSSYDKAMNAAFAKFGLTLDPAKIAAGGVYEFPTSGTSDEQLKAIMTQKWVAMFKQGHESFFDQTRTLIPAYSPAGVGTSSASYVPGSLTLSVNAVTGPGKFPKRLLFPSSSRDVNVNTPAQINVDTKQWWQK